MNTSDSVLDEARRLEILSSKIIQNIQKPSLFSEYEHEHSDTKSTIESVKAACKLKWMKLAEIQDNIKKTEISSISDNQTPKNISLLLREKALITQKIEFFKRKTVSFNQEHTTTQLKFASGLNSAIDSYRQALRELKYQEAYLESNISTSKKDLADLVSIGKALEDKLQKLNASRSAAAQQAHEEKMKRHLELLSSQGDKLSNILFKFIDKQYPPRTRQMTIDAHLSSKKISIPSLRSIVEKLLSLSFEDPQKYFQLPWGKYSDKEDPKGLCAQAWAPYLKLLYDAELIFVHPSDPSQIRLINFQTF